MHHQPWAVLLLGCAWVLWVNGLAVGKADRWSIDSAHKTREECWTAAGRISGLTYENRSVGEMLTLIKCLPDTIDPRQPK
jgi:hypothetical protein